VKKIKVRKLSIRSKILIPSIIINILVCSAIGLVLYQNTRTEMISMAKEETLVLSDMIGKQVDASKIIGLKPGDENTDSYKQVANELRDLNASETLKYLYTLYVGDDGKVYYGVDSDDNQDTYAPIGLEYEGDQNLVKQIIASGDSYVEDVINIDEQYGAMISAYAPIFNSDNQVVGILEGDYNAQTILDQLSSKIILNVLIVTLSGIFIFALFTTLLIGRICRSLNKVNQTVCELVNNEGDLTKKIEVHSGDELEVIANHMNELLEYIRSIMNTIAQNSSKLKESSNNVIEQIVVANASATDVSAMSEEISASMEETTASVEEIEESISFMAVTASEILEMATRGSELAIEISNRAEALSKEASLENENAEKMSAEIAEVLNKKIEESKSIEKIRELTEEIIGISAQTNLLSLNASIEAARAGEFGRGFAVVAEEISKLATSSAKVAGAIKEANESVIKAVNDLAKESGKMLEFNKATSMKGFHQLIETSDLYKIDSVKINEIMNIFVDQSKFIDSEVKEIDENIKAVAIAAEESAKGISEVADMTNKLTLSIEEINTEADETTKISKSLHDEVEKFKL